MHVRHSTNSLGQQNERIRRRRAQHDRQRQHYSPAIVFVKKTLHGSRASKESVLFLSGIRQDHERADDRLQSEVHGPEGGHEDAE